MTLPDIATARLPATYENAKQALANCASLDECQQWADKAAALASYAKQADDTELEDMSKRIRARAIRRAGELLKQVEPGHGQNNQYVQMKGDAGDTFHQTRTDLAQSAGMSVRQQLNAIRVARVPQEQFDAAVDGAQPATITKLASMGTQRKPIVDLKGRDPNEFNLAMHFVGWLEHICREAKTQDIDGALPVLNADERARVRRAISEIDALTDRIITRI